MSLIGSNNEEKIWNYLKSKGLNDYGIAGLLGNLRAESGLNPKNLQNSGNRKLGMTDDEYVASVDNGSYANFIKDSQGFGIAQWAYHTRKKALYEYAKSVNKSIGDLEVQLCFLYKELSEKYMSVLNTLKTATSVLEASNSVLLKFERPADCSSKVQQKRAEYGQEYYDKYHKNEQKGGVTVVSGVQTFSNSSLVEYIKISPKRTKNRNHVIDTISIHCTGGRSTVESLGNLFQTKEASSNYGIGYDGRVGMYVEEKDRSWCSSNAKNDHRAVTIEVACEPEDPYKVSDKVLSVLIDLVADICKRNNIKELKWKADKSLIGQIDKQNMTVHRWFYPKECPGDYLYSKHYYIANEVNKKLGVPSVNDVVNNESTTTSSAVGSKDNLGLKVGDEVTLVAGATYTSGKSIPSWLFKKTLYVRKLKEDGVLVSTLKVGAVTGTVASKYLMKNGQKVESSHSLPYQVRITTNSLNIRKGAGKNYVIVGKIKDGGVYTIIEEKDGQGATKWGRLKSKKGWISLDFTERV